MVNIDTKKCNGCGACAVVCSRKAIELAEGKAVINYSLCKECGKCLEVCGAGAIYKAEKDPQFTTEKKEVGGMPLGRGRVSLGRGRGTGQGFGVGQGMGLGFRGASPPWPYVGRGRGGLPRCWHPGTAGAAFGAPYYAGAPAAGDMPHTPQMSREQKLGFLKQEASAIKAHLDEIDARIKELEK